MSIQFGDLTLFTVEELSEKLGISERKIREYLGDGTLQGKKLGNRWYVSEQALTEYFLDYDNEPAPAESA